MFIDWREDGGRTLGGVFFGIMLAAILLGAGCSPKSNSDEASHSGDVQLTADQLRNIRIFTVARTRFHKTIEVTGVVDFDNDQATSVLAPFSGPVSQLLVSPGDPVTKGQPLAKVDSSDFATAVSTYRKTITAARNARRLADLDKDLLQHQSVSAREEEQAETDAVSAEADRDAALQALVSLNVGSEAIREIQEGRPPRAAGTIRSPIAGTLVEKLITPGQLLQAGTTPCFTVADLSRVWVMAQIFESDLSAVGVGDRATIVSAAGSQNFAGRVENISALIDPNTHSVAARVVADNPGELLKKQMYVRVTIQSARESSGILAPVSAILRDDQNLPFVYVAARDNGFVRRSVTLGGREGESYEIEAGLKPGDRIVADGAIFVQFMQDQ